MSKKPFAERSALAKVIAIVALAFSLAIVVTAERDLQSRAEQDVRGNKRLWRVLNLNALGALAYLRWGRRP